MATNTNFASVSPEAAEEYLLREYKTVCDIIDVASKFTSKIKKTYWVAISGCLTLFFTCVLSTASILYAKYNQSFDSVFNEKSVIVFLIILIVYCVFLLAMTGVMFALDLVHYFRQRKYRLLKSKISNDILDIKNNQLITNIDAKKSEYMIIKRTKYPLSKDEMPSLWKEIWIYFTTIVVVIGLITIYLIIIKL